MSTGQPRLAKAELIMENESHPAVQGGFRMFNRVVDWITNDRMQLINITDRINEYAETVAQELRAAGFRVEVNTRSDKIGAKIRDAQLQKIPFMLVLGDREMEQGQVAVRERTKGDLGGMSLDEFRQMAQRLVATRALTNT